MKDIVLVCPCDGYAISMSLDVAVELGPVVAHDQLEEAVIEHMDECIVLAASRLTASAARWLGR